MLKAELVKAAQKHCDSSFVDVNTISILIEIFLIKDYF
jgi:hypothetical protein